MLERVKSTAGSVKPDAAGSSETEHPVSAESETVGSETTETNLVDVEPTERMTDEDSINYDQLFELLKNKRRRRVLEYLLDVDDETTLDVLAEQIAAEENDKELQQITSQERKRVYVGLYQCHLPKMDDWGAISYNKPRGKITTAENTELFGHYLPAETQDEASDWREHWWTVPSALGLLFLSATLLGAAGIISSLQLVALSIVAMVVGVVLLQVSR